jgi:uncharacterized protein DUF268
VQSVSCLHVLEHIGLGRYGDTLDAAGDRKAAAELTRILAPGGQLLMVLPMNENPRVSFNSDRYYSLAMVKELFKLEIVDFDYIHEGQIKGAPVPKEGHYTGMFHFTK